jgi:oligoendopeptidase F
LEEIMATNDYFWDTSRIYPAPDSTRISEDMAEGERRVALFRERYRGNVADIDAAGLLGALRELEEIQDLVTRPQSYAYLVFSADSSDETNKALSQKASEFGNLMDREMLFFTLEILEMPDGKFAALAGDEQLAPYRHFLESARRFRPYTLPEREEQLLRLKNLTGVEAFTRLYDEFSASLTYIMEIDGEEREMMTEEILGLVHHPDPALRERAFSLFLERQGEQSVIHGSVFNTILLDHAQEMELRGYTEPRQPTDIGNELPREVVDRLMDVSEENYPLARDYFRLKARLLSLPLLKNSDIYAPIPGTERTYTYEEAKGLVLSSVESFNPAYREIIEAFFRERRIDVLPRPGKGGGAYCMGVSPTIPPYVLLNFTDNLRDVATLAHELGHGLHFVLASRQSVLNYHPPLPLAETASTFMEMVLARLLIDRETDRSTKISLLCALIEDIIATTFRQNVLTRFEQRIHEARKGGLLSAETLSEIWLEENRKLYGDAVEMIPPYRWGWTYISHFIHSRFYCYSYVFGELLVLSLFSAYRAEGDAFLPKFDAILSAGGSAGPAEMLAPAGINPADPGFWQTGYDLLRDLIQELTGLLKNEDRRC